MTSPLPALAELSDRLAAAGRVEDVVDVALCGLAELLAFRHSLLLLYDEQAARLVTLASHGYDEGGIGSEVGLGEGVIGMAAQRRRPMRVANLQRMLTYARSVQRSRGEAADVEIRLPGLADARSQVAAPMIARGVLVGVLAVESDAALAFDSADQHVLTVVAHLTAASLEREHAAAADAEAPEAPDADASAPAGPHLGSAPVRLRHYAVDGSTFLDDAYVIKGVAGRLLWKVASEHVASGRTEFTNREARLDPALELPPFRDNFESRLILLKRRLEERDAPLRIVSTARGRFELQVRAPIVLDRIS